MNSGWKLDQDILILFNAMAADVHYDLDFDNVSNYAPMKTVARREMLPRRDPADNNYVKASAFHDRYCPRRSNGSLKFHTTFCVHLIKGKKNTEKHHIYPPLTYYKIMTAHGQYECVC